MTTSHDTTTHWHDYVLAVALALFTLGCAWPHLDATPLGAAPDEWAHVTHVHEIAVDGQLIPDYVDSRILPAEARGNYLGHPPLYYSLLGLTGRVLDWGDPVDNYKKYRALSAALVALGMLLWVLAGRAFGLPSTWLVATVAAANAIPMFPYLAGSINNDNLGYLAVAIAVYGIARLPSWPRAAYYIGGLGLLVALLTKATVAVFLLAFFCCWLAPQLRRPSSPLTHRHFLAVLAAVVVVTAAWYLPVLLTHGTPFARSGTLYAAHPPPVDPVGVAAVAGEFFGQMWSRLPIISSHSSLLPLAGRLQYAVYALVLLPALAWLVSRWRRRDRNLTRERDTDRAGVAFMAALAVTVLLHFLVVWQGYLAHGLFSALQPRYYSYALPGLFIVGFAAFAHNQAVRVLFAGFALVAAGLLALSPPLTAQAQLRKGDMPSPTRLVLSPADAAGREERAFQLIFSDANAGYVDQMSQTDGRIHVRGWAIDAASKSAARRVWVLLDRRVVGTAATGFSRPDVAKSLASADADAAGFKLLIDGMPEKLEPCRFHLAAEQNDGSLAPLLHAGCDASAKLRADRHE